MSTLHCALENGVDLYVNEHQKIRHYRARSTEERRRKKENAIVFFFFTSCGAYVNCAIIALLYIYTLIRLEISHRTRW